MIIGEHFANREQLTLSTPIEGGGPRAVVSTAAFHARVRGSVPGLGGLKETKNVPSPSMWRSEAEHATSRSRRLPTILTFTRGWGRNIFCFFETAETGNRTPNSGVKGSGANHYPRAPAQSVLWGASVWMNV